MKTLVLLGSRDPAGRTARSAAAFLAGAVEAGSEEETILLPEMTLERCRQCENSGWGECKDQGSCVIEDDFAALVDRIASADVVAFATPVYFGDLSESMRAFLDRLRRVCMHDAGRARIQDKAAVGICMAGGSGGGTPACAVSLDKVLSRCGFDLADMVLVRRQNIDLKLDVLRATGRWIAAYAAGQ